MRKLSSFNSVNEKKIMAEALPDHNLYQCSWWEYFVPDARPLLYAVVSPRIEGSVFNVTLFYFQRFLATLKPLVICDKYYRNDLFNFNI